VFDRFFKSRTRSIKLSRFDISDLDDEQAYAVAGTAAGERWNAARGELALWRIRQEPSETTREFVNRAVDAIRLVEQYALDRSSGQSLGESSEVIRSLNAIAGASLMARYADDQESASALLVRERDGSAVSDSRAVAEYLASGRRYARRASAANFRVGDRVGPVADAKSDGTHTPSAIASGR
jgi:hypothetical protein